MVITLKYNYGDDNCRIYDNVDNSEKLGKVVSKSFLRFCIFLETSSPTILVIVAVAAAIVLIVLVVILVIYKKRKQTSNLYQMHRRQLTHGAQQSQDHHKIIRCVFLEITMR